MSERSGRVTLILGGARSGKSRVAERLAASLGAPVTYLATAAVPPDDDDFAARVAQHRARRPDDWLTIETGPDLIGALARVDGVALIDSLGTWLSALPDFEADAAALTGALAAREQPTVIVSEEVGLSIHPSTEVGRRFRDVLGALNEVVAAASSEVLLVVAGRTVSLDRLGGE